MVTYEVTGIVEERLQASYLEYMRRKPLDAARLREDFNRHFPTGIAFARQVWSEVARWRD